MTGLKHITALFNGRPITG